MPILFYIRRYVKNSPVSRIFKVTHDKHRSAESAFILRLSEAELVWATYFDSDAGFLVH